jgi:hypothetical protein
MTARRAVGVGLLVGTIGWLVIWFQTEPRANFDSLIYHADAFEYAGMSPAEADAASWTVFTRYASDRERAIITETIGGEWSTPISDRWMGLYQMRPVYPGLVALAYPVLGLRSPMAVSALVTVAFVVITFTGFGLLAGFRVATIATGAALLQVNFTHWLVFLTTDGVAMTLWATALVAIGLHVKTGRWPWLAALVGAALALALARPTGSLLPFVPAICTAAALLLRSGVWRRFGAATVAAAVPAAGVLVVLGALGFPGLSDVLQEIPTRHFALPDIADPVARTIALNQWAIPNRLLPTLFEQPLLLLTVVAGLAGFVVRPAWPTAPFLVAALVVPLAWIIHPVWFDAGRILAPAWVSLNLGVAILLNHLLVTQRERVLRVADRATQPDSATLAP